MLILGTMHNLEVYAVVIQKGWYHIFEINFDTILTGFNISREMTNRSLDIAGCNFLYLPRRMEV